MHPRLLADAFGRTETAIKARLALLSKHPPWAELSPETDNLSKPENDSWIADQGFVSACRQPPATTRRERLCAIGLKGLQRSPTARAVPETTVSEDRQSASAARTDQRPIEVAREWLRERQAHLQLTNQFTRNMLARTAERLRLSRAILSHPLPPIIKRAAMRIEPGGQ
ncbi:hypothetical protein ACVILK_005794 [Bradyrhizobium embrapense]